MAVNSQIMVNKPEELTTEEFTKFWDNAGYTMDPLAKVLKNIISLKERILETDFSIPNHYALLSFKAGEIAMAQKILDLLPDSIKSK